MARDMFAAAQERSRGNPRPVALTFALRAARQCRLRL